MPRCSDEVCQHVRQLPLAISCSLLAGHPCEGMPRMLRSSFGILRCRCVHEDAHQMALGVERKSWVCIYVPGLFCSFHSTQVQQLGSG